MQIHSIISPVADHTQDWPAWTDSDRWELGPEPTWDDRQWWVENSPANDDWHDLDGPPEPLDDDPPIDESVAEQAAWDDSLFLVS